MFVPGIRRFPVAALSAASVLLVFALAVPVVMADRGNSRILKGAFTGDHNALFEAGMMYRTGNQLGKDALKACQWLQAAANQGHVEAQYVLGELYSKGEGCIKDYAKAYFWYDLAARGGYEGAFAAGANASDMLSAREVSDVIRQEKQWLDCHASSSSCQHQNTIQTARLLESWLF